MLAQAERFERLLARHPRPKGLLERLFSRSLVEFMAADPNAPVSYIERELRALELLASQPGPF
jgi:hypothetical protein